MKKGERYHHGDLRAALLTVARAVVESDGAESLSLRAAARAIGVDVSAAYRHFRKKDDILCALAATGFDELSDQMRRQIAASPGVNAKMAFSAAADAYVTYGIAHPNLYRLMFGGRFTAAQIRASRGGTASDAYALLGETLDGLVAAGAVAPAARDGAERVAWAQVHGLVSLVIDGRGHHADLGRHIDVLLHGLVWR